MRKLIPVSVALALVSALVASARERRVWTATHPLPRDGSVAVENVQGDIQVDAWDEEAVEVTVTKTALGSASRLDDVGVAFQVDDGSLVIRTVYPAESGEPVRVDYRLRVPRQARLERLRTVQGDIKVAGTEGPVDARTLYGNIARAGGSGPVTARTVNGNVAVWLRALPGGAGPVVVDTLNGDLELALPEDANADLELSTLSGKIEGSFAFLAPAALGDSTRRARVGEGGVPVRMRTVRGNIRVVKREDER